MRQMVKIADVSTRPTSISRGSHGENNALITRMNRRAVASPRRTFATRTSPARPASASTASGRDQTARNRPLALEVIKKLPPRLVPVVPAKFFLGSLWISRRLCVGSRVEAILHQGNQNRAVALVTGVTSPFHQ